MLEFNRFNNAILIIGIELVQKIQNHQFRTGKLGGAYPQCRKFGMLYWTPDPNFRKIQRRMARLRTLYQHRTLRGAKTKIAGLPARELQLDMNVLQLITSIPLDVRWGSRCYIGTSTLVEGLCRRWTSVEIITLLTITPGYTATRLLFDKSLRWRRFDGFVTISTDADGYAIAHERHSPPQIAPISSSQ